MMNKNRTTIAFIIDELNVGGTEKQLLQTINHLDKNLFEPILICLRPSAYLINTELPCEYHILNVTTLKSPIKLIKFINFLRKSHIDIVQTYFIDANLFGVLAVKLAGVRKIVSCRRDMGFWYTPKLLFVLRIFNKFVDRFLVNSHAVKENIIKFELIPDEKIDVIYNGIEIKLFEKNYNLAEINKELGINDEESVVGIVANLNRKVKRVDIFLEAAQKVLLKKSKVVFVIIGDGYLRKDLEEQSVSLGIKDRIIFAGQKANIYPYLSVFNIGVISSDSEGFSNSILEYAASGIPVVATDTGGNRELLNSHNLGLLVPTGNPDKLAYAILVFLEDNLRMEKISRNAKTIVKNEYTWEIKIKEIEEYYQKILTDKRGKTLTGMFYE